MTTIPAEFDRTPVSRTTPSETASETNRPDAPRASIFYFCRSGLTLVISFALTSILLYEGVHYIRGDSRILTPTVLNNSLPQAFLVIGFWGLALITLALLFLVTLYKTGRVLYKHWKQPVASKDEISEQAAQ